MKRRLPFVLVLALTMLLLACSFFGQSVAVADNERGVFADDQGNLQVLPPGTHMLSPFAGEAVIYPMTDQVYTMTGQLGAEGVVVGDDAVEARSKDGRQLWLDSAVTFHFVESKLTDVHRIWHDPERFVNSFIRPTTRNVVYNTAGQFNYEEVVSSKRGGVEAVMSRKLAEEFAKQGVELVKFSLLDVRGN
jgi:regulator of protease activity HflC (stomatin/prohibitin superfamily)